MQPIRRHGLAPRARRALFALLACALLFSTVVPAAAAPVRPVRLRVCIDPGHGGSYSGAVSGGVAEERINLAVAKKLASILRSRGVEVVMTRTGDSKVYRGGDIRTWRWIESEGVYRYAVFSAPTPTDRLRRDLQARADVARRQGADLYVSIHCNAGSSSARGIEVWHSTNDPSGRRYASDVLAGMLGATGAKNRGVKTANFYVTRWSNQPAVLVECGFLSNPSERARLASSSYQTRLARGIANGIDRFADRDVIEPYQRAGGATRYHSAAAISRAGWAEGADTVILAPGDSFAEPLVASPLAASLDAPILTTRRDTLPTPIAAELARLAPERIIAVGDSRVLPPSIVSAAASAAALPAEAVVRLGGADRYATSLAVARAVESSQTSSVVVVSGEVWPDALSIAPSAAARREPILLSRPTGLDDASLEFVRGGETTRAVTVVGGTSVLPSAALRGLPFVRLAGRDRYATNWQVFKTRYTSEQRLRPVLASGAVYTDATVVGPYAAKIGVPVVLFGRGASSAELRPYVYARRDEPLVPMVVGGPNSVSAYVSSMLSKWEMWSH